jgi:hypothetical protein
MRLMVPVVAGVCSGRRIACPAVSSDPDAALGQVTVALGPELPEKVAEVPAERPFCRNARSARTIVALFPL